MGDTAADWQSGVRVTMLAAIVALRERAEAAEAERDAAIAEVERLWSGEAASRG